MNYQLARPHIRSGDLIAWRGATLAGAFVRAWTGEPYAHLGIAYRIYDRVFVLHAHPIKGVVMQPLSRMLPAYWLELGTSWTDKAGLFAFERLGLPYSFADAVRAGFGLPLHKDSRFQCAEYATDVLTALGLNLAALNTSTPGKLVSALDDLPQRLEP